MYSSSEYPDLAVSEAKAAHTEDDILQSSPEYQNLSLPKTRTIHIAALLKLLRPEQWVKNIFVFTGVLFSEHFITVSRISNLLIAIALFCVVSGAVYVLNDLVDIESDKIHPQKRLRPLPSGLVSKPQAVAVLLSMLCVSIAASFFFNFQFALIILAYFLINILYSIKLKKIVFIDVMVISMGFLLRVMSGYIAIGEHISFWSLLCTLFLTMYLGLSKRKDELITLDRRAEEHRKILNEYSLEMINQILPIMASCAILSYSLFAIQVSRNLLMALTIPLAIYGMLRFEYVTRLSKLKIYSRISPVRDIPFILNMLIFIGTSITVMQI